MFSLKPLATPLYSSLSLTQQIQWFQFRIYLEANIFFPSLILPWTLVKVRSIAIINLLLNRTPVFYLTPVPAFHTTFKITFLKPKRVSFCKFRNLQISWKVQMVGKRIRDWTRVSGMQGTLLLHPTSPNPILSFRVQRSKHSRIQPSEVLTIPWLGSSHLRFSSISEWLIILPHYKWERKSLEMVIFQLYHS